MTIYARLVAIALVLALAGGMGWRAGVKHVTAAWDAERAAVAEVAAESQRMARITETRRQEGATHALDTYAIKARANAAAAAAARDELGQLRDALSASSAASAGHPDAPGCADDLARARQVVGQCVGTVQALAAVADDGEARLSALQAWVRAATAP